MLVAFTLTMPSSPSWNGKWSGADRLWCVVREYTEARATEIAKATSSTHYYYRWDDGWAANVQARIVSAAEAAKLRKKSAGFKGYEWMIDSIERYGKIYADHERPKAVTA